VVLEMGGVTGEEVEKQARQLRSTLYVLAL